MQQHSSIAACTVHLFSERGLILISTIPATKIDILAGELGQTVARLFQRVIFNIEKSIPCHRERGSVQGDSDTSEYVSSLALQPTPSFSKIDIGRENVFTASSLAGNQARARARAHRRLFCDKKRRGRKRREREARR